MPLASHLRKELRNSLLRTATNKSNMTEGEREIGIENLMIYEPIYKHEIREIPSGLFIA